VDDIIYNIKRYISENLANDLSLTRLSEYTTLSNCYLSHIFKESTGVNVVDYITEQRMMRAKSLLETTSINIELVAASCGYGTPHYFSKKFKQYFGLTPRSYRIAYGEKQLSS
jgi:YesN/AraC family two-component response regulator